MCRCLFNGMRRIFLWMIVLLPNLVAARMYETLEQAIQRYGDPSNSGATIAISRRADGAGTLKYYNKPIKLVLRLYKKTVICIEYIKGEPMSGKELSEILERNSPDSWKEFKNEDSEIVKIRKAVEQIRDYQIEGRKAEKPEFQVSPCRFFYTSMFVAAYYPDIGDLTIWQPAFNDYLFGAPAGAASSTPETLKGL